MTRRRLTAAVVILAAIVVCGGALLATSRRARQPVTTVSLEGGGVEIAGEVAGGCVIDTLPPTFSPGAFVALDANASYELAVLGPRPAEMTVTVYRAEDGQPGEALSTTALTRPPRRVAWQPPTAAGDAILETYVARGPGDCWLYWFPVTLP